MTLIDVHSERTANPVDEIELLAAQNDWTFERSDEDEIAISIAGDDTDYHVAVSWLSEIEALHVACAFDIKVTAARRNEVTKLLALVNEQLWVGHFDMWSNGSVLLYRHGLLLGDEGLLSLAQAQVAVEAAVEECDRFYPAFQFVLWGDKSPADALDSALVDHAGEA